MSPGPPPIPTEPAAPLKRGRRTDAEREAEPAVWYCGKPRSPAGVEAQRIRNRLRQRARRQAGSPK